MRYKTKFDLFDLHITKMASYQLMFVYDLMVTNDGL